MDAELREIGLKKLEGIDGISETDIEFAGRLSQLGNAPEVEVVYYPENHNDNSGQVYLEEDKNAQEIIGITERVGFSNPLFTGNAQLRIEINDNEYYIQFHQPEY
ncbi:hypothetical protein HOE04_04730 [archaeon]|jgi:hypothetical protein|nr:hypothetical protein [archaeon]